MDILKRARFHRVTAPHPAMGVTALFLLSSLGFSVTAQAQQCSKPFGGPNMDLKPDYITQTTFADGATVAFSCHPGYTPAGGSATITCIAGLWSAVQLRCERKSCGPLPEVDYSEVIYTDGTQFGDTAKVQCDPGYNAVGGSAVLRCEVEGWMGRLPTCEGVECKDPVIENGQYESGSRPPHRLNAVVTYSCKAGYTMEGPSTVTCNLTSQWFPSLPKCKMITYVPVGGSAVLGSQQCSKPFGGPNMDLKPDYITQTTFADGATVAFSCHPGYTPAGGSSTITCTAGHWSAVQLRCERKSCGPLPEVDYGEVIYTDGTQFGDTAKVQCDPGYNAVGGSAVLRCEVEGWMGRLPTCEGVECKDPVIENGQYESGSRPPHRLNAVVTYSCKPGYKMEGPSTVTCNLTSQWFPSLPKCKSKLSF
ncbi:sushi, von Willebrand factor type A, EGF and pentraxin domain-containing protein 1 isoform X2 [Fundulus heteroclitus]|uniref:sushi, von Willebrand factor type A, EGF and pentraxin domain-containing protein 1 isoform X2 n=1 Tax=Fundulus heteroclitus TaxID=8078 RepID=UPI00165A825E|nr:sushi, von Willebrand factor type A, EGF and pentraxin domain-containing protein 1 isoform X2 [Fundulus heteroclitus]